MSLGRYMWTSRSPFSSGDTPLHRACRLGNFHNVAELLRHDPNLIQELIDEMNTPLQAAGCMQKRIDPQHHLLVREVFAKLVPNSVTAIYFHEDCSNHVTRELGSQRNQPWECPERLIAITSLFRKTFSKDPL